MMAGRVLPADGPKRFFRTFRGGTQFCPGDHHVSPDPWFIRAIVGCCR